MIRFTSAWGGGRGGGGGGELTVLVTAELGVNMESRTGMRASPEEEETGPVDEFGRQEKSKVTSGDVLFRFIHYCIATRMTIKYLRHYQMYGDESRVYVINVNQIYRSSCQFSHRKTRHFPIKTKHSQSSIPAWSLYITTN